MYLLWKEKITTTSRAATSLRKIFSEVPRETHRHHILLLNLKIFDEVRHETPRHHILLLNRNIFDDKRRSISSM